MKKHAPLDIDGKDLKIGDWVRVVAVPLTIKDMPEETKEAFSNAVGHTFQIVSFDELGCLHLELWPKISLDTIWLEPFCARRYRRYKQLSKSFQKVLEMEAAPRPPRYEVKFDITLKEGVDVEEFGYHLLGFGTGGGFACWPDARRIKGSVYANKSEPDAMEMLEGARRAIAESEHIDFHDVSEVAEADDN